MPKSQDKRTTAENLEEKFDRGEDVLDYFDGSKARVIRPQSKSRPQKKVFLSGEEEFQTSRCGPGKSTRYRKTG
jgi:hypothetical protein